MSTTHRMERIEADIQEPILTGDSLTYRDATVVKYAWMCGGCRLVWSMKHQATDCESRSHVERYVQEYWTNGFDPITGKPNPPTLYPRVALRREPAYDPETLAVKKEEWKAREARRNASMREYSVQVGAYLFHVVLNPEAEAARSLAACTAHDDWRISATARVSKARMRGQTVWQYTADGLPHSIYVTHEQAEELGLPSVPQAVRRQAQR